MKPVENPFEIKNFVRNVLGCTCPDEVFEHIRAEPLSLAHLPHCCLSRVSVGGRLLIYIVSEIKDPRTLPKLIESVAEAGLRERDESGYNRIRLVVAKAEDDHSGPLILPSSVRCDDRFHLHLIDSAKMPELATTPMPRCDSCADFPIGD